MYTDSLQHPSLHEGLIQSLETAFDDHAANSSVTDKKRSYRLMPKLNQLGHVSSKLDRLSIRMAAPEIMQGIEQFLRRQSVDVPQVASTEKPTRMRHIIERIKPGKLENTPSQIAEMLTSIYNVLPDDGQRFKDGVYAICKSVTARARQGVSGRELTRKLLDEVSDFLHKK